MVSELKDEEPIVFLSSKKNKIANATKPVAKKAKLAVSGTAEPKSLVEKCLKHYSTQCCNKKCLWLFTMQQCLDYHQFFSKKTSAESTVWLKNFLNSATQEVGTEKRVHLVVDKKSVCHAAFKQLYGISNNKYYAALEKVSEPDVIPVHGNLNNQHALKQTAREHMNHWITSYVDEAGEQNPTNDSIYIPKYVAKSSLYSMYQFDWIARKLNASELPSPSSFYNIFERQFGHVKFLKQTVLGRCDFCMSIPTQKSKITSEVDKNIFLEACAQHQQLYTQERTSYSIVHFFPKLILSRCSILHLIVQMVMMCLTSFL